ncbi:MAG: phosphoenolpyruvate synthase, partial [Myxococcales bacterium]|nr:phosphoenolpyruvate synthase [Myxococcales bacterium]
MDRTVLDLDAITPADLPRVGGKAAGLAALARVDGARVPPGFVVTTDAFRDVGPPDAPLPDDLVHAISAALARLGDDAPVAVRSSATAEDLPGTSFAGQHDSFLGVVGRDAVLDAIRRVRASLYSDRARAYRDRHLIPDDAVAMAVVVQRMVPARAAG